MSKAAATVFHEAVSEEIKEVEQDTTSGGQAEEVVSEPVEKVEEKAPPKSEAKPKDDPAVELERIKKALDEERAERKRFRDEAKKRDEELAQIKAGWERWNNALKSQQEAAQKPKYDENPLEHLRIRAEEAEKRAKEFEERFQRYDQQSAHQGQLNQFVTTVQSSVDAFRQQKADYDAAYQHVMSMKHAELEAMGIPADQIPQALGHWEMNVAALAMRNGKNPGEVVYQQAVRFGYKAQEAGGSNGAEDLKRLAKGQEAAKTLGGGQSGDTELSLESLNKMSEDEINEYVKKNWSKLEKMK